MSDTTLFLGPVQFTEFEIPDSIKAGGSQGRFIHKYPGGMRSVDTMGPDDAPVTWQGIFLDGTAQDRCKQLDIMRRAGQQIVASWGEYQYLVVIEEFLWDFKRTWHIPYTITLTVVQDQTQPIQSSAPDVDSQTSDDASDAQDDSDEISQSVDDIAPDPNSGVTEADVAAIGEGSVTLASSIDGIESVIGSVTSISTASVNFQLALGVQAGAAVAAGQGLQQNLDSAVTLAGAPALFASGTSPVSMAASLSNLSAISQSLASTVHCTSVLGRMSKNINLLGK